MIEIIKNLYVGSQEDYESNVKFQSDWFVIHACKEPYHRQALGYTGRAIANTHPEYLIVKRDNRLILNLVDVADPKYISKEIVDAAIVAIDENIDKKTVLIHCNQGMSRSATIGLLYLHHVGIIATDNFKEAESEFLKLYPPYNPANGMRTFAEQYWNNYTKRYGTN
ncbi:phosphatase [Bacteroidaceae bacterium HV4-6-C5C]|nr:phosphatase [Bacteroidaceae bacterium HV4-6-C5C]